MEQWSLIPNMVYHNLDITIQILDYSPQVQDYKVISIIENDLWIDCLYIY